MSHRFLFFRNGTGSAMCGNVTMHLTHCPRLPGMRFVEIEYVPRVKNRVLAEANPDSWRDMTEIECQIADSALERMREQSLQVFL
jgi:hypothetical protein